MGKARFSMAFDDGAGGMGPVVVARGRSGPVVRRRAVYKRKSTPEQLVQEARLKAVGAAWSLLGATEAAAWDAFAKTIQKRNSVNGTVYSPSGYNAFSGLALRLVQIDPDAAIPSLPPTGRFAGDRVRITVAGFGEDSLPLERRVRREEARKEEKHEVERRSSSGGRGGVENDGPLTPTPLPQRGEGLEVPVLTFLASGANAPGVLTEIMVEKLANVRRKPTGVYKSRGFVAFSEDRREFDLPVEAGVYACATRFVARETGEAKAIRALGVVTVG